jgi:MraZ protein
MSHAKEVEIDSAGRILLPPDSRAPVGLSKDVTLIGIGRRFFEVWDRKRFEEYERTNGDGGLQSGFERLTQLEVK